jgi:hypothetical protein
LIRYFCCINPAPSIPQSKINNQQSTISNRKSAIENQQSKIGFLQRARGTCVAKVRRRVPGPASIARRAPPTARHADRVMRAPASLARCGLAVAHSPLRSRWLCHFAARQVLSKTMARQIA